jgi:hypothetical protein
MLITTAAGYAKKLQAFESKLLPDPGRTTPVFQIKLHLPTSPQRQKHSQRNGPSRSAKRFVNPQVFTILKPHTLHLANTSPRIKDFFLSKHPFTCRSLVSHRLYDPSRIFPSKYRDPTLYLAGPFMLHAPLPNASSMLSDRFDSLRLRMDHRKL